MAQNFSEHSLCLWVNCELTQMIVAIDYAVCCTMFSVNVHALFLFPWHCLFATLTTTVEEKNSHPPNHSQLCPDDVHRFQLGEATSSIYTSNHQSIQRDNPWLIDRSWCVTPAH